MLWKAFFADWKNNRKNFILTRSQLQRLQSDISGFQAGVFFNFGLRNGKPVHSHIKSAHDTDGAEFPIISGSAKKKISFAGFP